MATTDVLAALDEPRLARFAQTLALALRPGDVIALRGDLGAGKTTFARALITALAGGGAMEIPSPTFTLVQTYDTPRMAVAHFDLYRLTDPGEMTELGLEHTLNRGVALVEWPERAGDQLPPLRLEIEIADEPRAVQTDLRQLTVQGSGDWAPRLARLLAVHRFIETAGWGSGDAQLTYLQGDASVRHYARLTRPDGASALLMDWPRQPDGPPVRDGKPYSQIAHLAEDVRAFVALATALRGAGLSAPKIFASDIERGLLLIEDFGDRAFGQELRNGVSQAEMWTAGTDTLIALRGLPIGPSLPLPGGGTHVVPRFGREAMQIETELLPDWYWPALHGAPIPGDVRDEFIAAWNEVFDRILALPFGLSLRDAHSPNLLWLPDRTGAQSVGLIDFQDAVFGHAAYDLVSLLQDARVDVPADLEADLLDHYCSRVAAAEEGFDRDAFTFAYAALGAQRNTKILGIFARLARRDGKPAYLAHIPRLWRYLERDLAHPELSRLRGWYDQHLPPAARATSLAF